MLWADGSPASLRPPFDAVRGPGSSVPATDERPPRLKRRSREDKKAFVPQKKETTCGREFDSLLQAKGLCTTEFWFLARSSVSRCSACRLVWLSVAAQLPGLDDQSNKTVTYS